MSHPETPCQINGACFTPELDQVGNCLDIILSSFLSMLFPSQSLVSGAVFHGGRRRHLVFRQQDIGFRMLQKIKRLILDGITGILLSRGAFFKKSIALGVFCSMGYNPIDRAVSFTLNDGNE